MPAAGDTSKDHAFAALDGLRGVAALSVVVFHFSVTPARAHFLPSAYLAVDFFFMLSGFVLSHAYAARLSSGVMSPPSFMRVRLIRLYPLYIFGATVTVLNFALASVSHAPHPNGGELALAYALGAVLLPAHVHFNAAAFPLNSPSWSLSTEIGSNAVWAFAAKLLSNWILIAAAAATGALLVWQHQFGGDDFSNFASGWTRVGWSFPAGVLLHRAFVARSRLRFSSAAFIALSAALVAIFALPPNVLVALISSFALFPAMIWIGASVQLRGRLLVLATWSGAVSYALYITHVPVGQLLLLISEHRVWDTQPLGWTRLLLWTTAAVAAAWALDVALDRPIRTSLSRALVWRRRAEVAPGEATP